MADKQYSLKVKLEGVEQSVKTVGELEKALAATKNELKQLEVGSDAFNELASQARALQDELKGSFKEATNFDKSLGQLTESVSRLGSSVAASFAIATSALQLFGTDSEEITELQVKSQQALAIAFGATTIATNAAKLAGDLKLVSDRLSVGVTNLLTGAVGKQTVTKAANAVATGTATVAQIALNAAMSANPIFLVVGALGALIGALTLFSSSSKDATVETESLTDALERQNAAYQSSKRFLDEETNTQIKLIETRKNIALSGIKNEEERIRIEEEANKKINALRDKQLKRDLGLAEAQLNGISRAQDIILDIKGKFDAKNLSEEDKQAIKLKAAFDKQVNDKSISEQRKLEVTQNYYKQLFELQRIGIETNNKLSEEEKNKQLENVKASEDVLFKVVQLNNALTLSKTNEQLEEAKIEEKRLANQRANEEQRKRDGEKRKQDRERDAKERLDLETKFFNDIEKLTQNANQNLLNIQRQYDDILVEQFFDSENIIAQFDKSITKLRIDSERALADAQANFNKERADFIKNSQEALKRGVITKEELESQLAKLDEDFKQQQLIREQTFAAQGVQIEQEKADKIAEINIELNRERLDLLVEGLDAEIDLSNRRIGLISGFGINEIKVRQALERQRIKAVRDLELQSIQTQLDEDIKNLQGTEEQKTLAKEKLIKQANEKVAIVNENFRQSEKEKEVQNTEEVYKTILQKVQEYAAIAGAGISGVIGLFSSLNELANVKRENDLRDLRDYTNEQTSILNEGYNRDLANLQERYKRGLITQDEYNSQVESLQGGLNEATLALTEKQAAAELEAKRKAFESEKKIKIANTIASGFQGALQAFVSASSLPFPASLIVGTALAGLVAAQTGINVAAIKKTQFDGGAPNITAINSSTITPQTPQNNPVTSGGGLTIFNPELVRRPSSGNATNDPTSGGATRVYVLESDITQTQRRVNVSESTATIP